jgi:hypothetical protein
MALLASGSPNYRSLRTQPVRELFTKIHYIWPGGILGKTYGTVFRELSESFMNDPG